MKRAEVELCDRRIFEWSWLLLDLLLRLFLHHLFITILIVIIRLRGIKKVIDVGETIPVLSALVELLGYEST